MGAVIGAFPSYGELGSLLNNIAQSGANGENLIRGYNCSPETAEKEMQATKELWNKTGGKNYVHILLSYNVESPNEEISVEQAQQIAEQFVKRCPVLQDFETLAITQTHGDKERVHIHFAVNSVNRKDGHGFHTTNHILDEMVDLANTLYAEQGLSVKKHEESLLPAVQKNNAQKRKTR